MRSLTKESASGFAWLLMQSGGARLIGFLAQIFLARLLTPADFGDIALVTSVAAVTATLVGFGVDDVVLSRSRRLQVWVTPAFWVSLAFSLIGAGALLAFAPLAGSTFTAATRFSACSLSWRRACPWARWPPCRAPICAFSCVFVLWLLTLPRSCSATSLLTIVLAWRGFGAYSFVIPTPLAALARAILFWQVARPPRACKPRRWPLRVLLRSGSTVFGQKLLTSLRENGDYLLLGMVARKAEVGLYFMAFKLAAVPVYTLVSSMAGVLFPALAQLRNEPARQRAAALSASRAIALAVVPLSFLQAAVAPSLLRLFFGERWQGAAGMLSILTVGLAFDAIPCVASSLLTANGKFSAQWRWSAASLPAFFLLIGTGCKMGGALGVALAVALFFMLSAPVFSYYALRLSGCTWRAVAGIYLPPTICSTGAVCLGLFFARLPQVYGRDLAMIAVVCAISLLTYTLSVRWLSPVATRDAMQKLSLMWGRTV